MAQPLPTDPTGSVQVPASGQAEVKEEPLPQVWQRSRGPLVTVPVTSVPTRGRRLQEVAKTEEELRCHP